MSPHNPLEELDVLVASDGRLPQTAQRWAEDATNTCVGILETVEDMQSNGVHAPTERQSLALRNIFDVAMGILEQYGLDGASGGSRRKVTRRRMATPREARSFGTCTSCFMELPASRICDCRGE